MVNIYNENKTIGHQEIYEDNRVFNVSWSDVMDRLDASKNLSPETHKKAKSVVDTIKQEMESNIRIWELSKDPSML